jgi:ankyrin repeat protein
MSHEFKRQFDTLASGDTDRLEQLARELSGFPHGTDDFIHRHWITNAIDSGSVRSVKWMLEKGVDLNFRDAEGYTPLHSALEQPEQVRYELMELLLEAAAPINIKGINDWTPTHAAAARDDVEALKILVSHGADLNVRTSIDDYATPLEEARNLGKLEAVKFLECVV